VSADTLGAALRKIGIACSVEAQGKLAVLIPEGDVSVLEQAEVRRAALALLGDHGFTHLALELVDAGGGAALPRD
jgi:hypothetical protein